MFTPTWEDFHFNFDIFQMGWKYQAVVDFVFEHVPKSGTQPTLAVVDWLETTK